MIGRPWQQATRAVEQAVLSRATGEVCSVRGTVIHARGLDAAVGDVCNLHPSTDQELLAEVVGFTKDALVLMPYGDPAGLHAGCRVTTTGRPWRVPIGEHLLGRVLDAFGRPLDDGPPLTNLGSIPMRSEAPAPLERGRLDTLQSTGVRAIDAFTTCARGQRVGVFAGSGVGKSVLLGMISRHSDADVNVIALVGERGREVREFLEDDLGPEGLRKSVVVVATSDQSPVLRIRAGECAMTIAEWFRDHDRDVMFLMDSITRYAMALREIGLAVGEPPTTKGYTPSTFAQLPRLLERAGARGARTITGFFSVLVEGDDLNDPVADALRATLDGHVVLDRNLARQGHYPAIDVLGSVSRLMPRITSPEHRAQAARILHALKLVEDHADLVAVGAYKPGSHTELDRALAAKGAIDSFLRQDLELHEPFESTLTRLLSLGAAA